MAPVDTTYYDRLGVAPGCEDADLRKAYKKKALQLHPDKGGDPEDFRQMKEAYDVLSDPRKRGIYDSYGIAGIQMMEGQVASPEAFMMVLSRTGKAVIISSLCTLGASVLLPVVLLALRWDNTADYHWSIVCIPVWVFQFVFLTLLSLCMRAPPPQPDESGDEADIQQMYEDRKRAARTIRWTGVLIIFLLTSLEVLIILRLEGTVEFSWFLVFVPYFLLETLVLSARIMSALALWKAMARASVPRPPCFIFWLVIVWTSFLRLVTASLVAARADDLFTATWYVCLVPFMFWGLMKFIRAIIATLVRCAQEKQAGVPPSDEGPSIIGACCVVGFWLFMGCFAASKLDGNSYSAFIMLIPVFILVCCNMVCLPACLVIASGNGEEQDIDMGPPPDVEAARVGAASAAGGAPAAGGAGVKDRE